MSASPILSVRDVTVEYQSQGIRFAAVSGISFDLDESETLGLVGESGCGKSTIGRAILQLPRPTRGRVTFLSKELTRLSESEMRPVRRRLQVIFQDPVSSLNPRRKVRDIVAEPLDIAGIGTRSERHERVAEILTAVGMNPGTTMDRRPHQFSGGQCQRICIARALIQEPKLIVCDEPVSSLDVSVQAQILNLLQELREELNLTYVFISHNLAVVEHMSSRVAVMYLGRLIEFGTAAQVFDDPKHPYTSALLDSVLTPEPQYGLPEITTMGLEFPNPLNPPPGCAFHPRCPRAMDVCSQAQPQPTDENGRLLECHLYGEETAAA